MFQIQPWKSRSILRHPLLVEAGTKVCAEATPLDGSGVRVTL